MAAMQVPQAGQELFAGTFGQSFQWFQEQCEIETAKLKFPSENA